MRASITQIRRYFKPYGVMVRTTPDDEYVLVHKDRKGKVLSKTPPMSSTGLYHYYMGYKTHRM